MIFDPAVKLVTPVLLIVNDVTGARLSTPVILMAVPATGVTVVRYPVNELAINVFAEAVVI